MNKKTCKIYTDASFDSRTKLATYSIIIKQNGKVIKAFGKKCGVKLDSSTESEVFAVFQAMNIIETNLLKEEGAQNFLIKTDCEGAKDFFIGDKKINIFKKNTYLLNRIKKSNKRIKEKLLTQNCQFKIEVIPREQNKIAHNCSYKAFKSLKKIPENNPENILINKNLFLELVKSKDIRKCQVFIYLFQISDSEDIILKTQKEIANFLDIPISTINKIFKEFITINVLSKIKNGIYSLNL